ncbi:hypothetical protein Nepgr_006573 [Nepenthes gracilis]|uniref:Uncharacterized protein n=1 Tax=Nepenthes gracilis TaxID=150966 RepID=A0AAD3S5E6_NEPGR|nr:hypothetical protein Nepgr_006573 [Nepenthes gracilis]
MRSLTGLSSLRKEGLLSSLRGARVPQDIQREAKASAALPPPHRPTSDRIQRAGIARKWLARTGPKDQIASQARDASSANPTATTSHSIQQGSQSTPMNQPRVTFHKDKSARRHLRWPAGTILKHHSKPNPVDDVAMLHRQDDISHEQSRQSPAKRTSQEKS